MSTISLRLPESLHKKVRELAKAEDVSINQLISTALAEKMSALMTVEYLQGRAARGDRSRFERAMGKVADADPDDADRLVMPNKGIVSVTLPPRDA
jgi:predicted transcriptional regulator